MIFLTYNDLYSGVFKSQVLDVIDFLENEFNVKIQLISFVPRGFVEEQRKLIQNYRPGAKVYPISLGLSRWKLSKFKLKKIAGNETVCIARGAFAAVLSQKVFRSTIYDGRAAVKSEVEEYNVTGGNKKLDQDLIQAEKLAVLNSDYRIAVSNQLIKYWQSVLGYNSKDHVVIPCTLTKNQSFNRESNSDVIKIVYSGGVGPWQSFDLVAKLLRDYLNMDTSTQVVFMTKQHKKIEELISEFPDRVERLWVKPEDVFKNLSKADYGILIREDKVTNQVASPVKFAEYVSAGLKVLISSNVGDYSDMVNSNNLGIIIENEIPKLIKPTLEEKQLSINFCKENLCKGSQKVRKNYETLLKKIAVI